MNELDRSIMLALNFDGGSVLDSIMLFASGIPNWIPLYLVVLWVVYRQYGWKYMLFALLFIGLGVGICDQVCNFFKHNIEYLRPTKTDLLPYLHSFDWYHCGNVGTCFHEFLHISHEFAHGAQGVVYGHDARLYAAHILFPYIHRGAFPVPDIVRVDTRHYSRRGLVLSFRIFGRQVPLVETAREKK